MYIVWVFIAAEEQRSDSEVLEEQLLASDNDEEREPGAGGPGGPGGEVQPARAAPADESGLSEQQDYYLDRKFDVGNLRVSTLYYPGRPQ